MFGIIVMVTPWRTVRPGAGAAMPGRWCRTAGSERRGAPSSPAPPSCPARSWARQVAARTGPASAQCLRH
eukprot:8363595-Pyramimonas_sp.AAC.1